MSFPDLQNGLYNSMLKLLGLDNASNFQLIQPTVSFPAHTTDANVWKWMNEIPPLALIQSGSGGNQFFSDYQGVIDSLTPSGTINFEGDIGPAAFKAWNAYLATQPATSTQLPTLFFNWAFSNGFPSVADKGSSDLSAILLDPIARAQNALIPYGTVTTKGKPHDWSLGYAQLVKQLANGEKKFLTEADVQSKGDVKNSWAASGSSGGFLFWGGGSSDTRSSMSMKFASKAVSVSMNFKHVLPFVPVPGAWYDSDAFGLAYSSRNGKVWNPTKEVTWEKTFGANGDMQRFTSSLIVVSGMEVTASSSYSFSSSEQTTITHDSGGGFWPFGSGGSDSSITTTHAFDKAGGLTIKQSSPEDVPTLIGVIVMPAAKYVGHRS